MVSRSGHYCGALFTGSREVTQGYLLPPTICNMVFDALICHWETVVAGKDVGSEVFRRALLKLPSLFYADYGLIVSPQLAKLKESMEVLTGLFEIFGLQNNLQNTVGMVCQTCRTTGMQLMESYIRHVIG